MSFLKHQQIGSPIKRIHLNKKTFIILAIVIILGVGAWFAITRMDSMLQYFNPKSSIDVKKEAQIKQEKASAVYNQAYTQYISGDEAAAQTILDESIKEGDSAKDKAKVYLQKASIAVNSGDYANAQTFAKKAEELDPTKASAQMMAIAAAQLDDISEAIADYKLALSRITGNSGMDELDKQELKDKITDLGGSL